jgi:hypothetical protein
MTVHARGFPGFGPPTMCGEGLPPEEVVSVVTCEKCLDVLESAASLAKRLEELHGLGTKVKL